MEDDRPDKPGNDSPGDQAADQPESPTDQSTVTALPDTGDPQRIGPYRILQKIGEGGMGVVYEAEQETPVRRRVALKLIKWGMDTKQVVARFEAERQALALMNHPNVAKVFDAGATTEGRPYFVMEYVKGVPITEHCDRQRLTTRERLELFMQACEGVQHAHQKGIIHRDIKPSNILVEVRDAKAVPKIIDFGVAKATAQRLTEHTLFTELGQFVGTPEYMSPEQAEMTHQDIDTRTDVYSLGVVLYELLVGALPFDSKELRRSGFDEIRRKIREEEPSKPSTRFRTLDGEVTGGTAKQRRTDPRSLERQLRGDLDWIAMRALEKERTRRYGSASELAADIQRHLAQEPISAAPPNTLYRTMKFARRHRTAVLAACAVTLALAVGIAAAGVGFIRAKRAEAVALEEAASARQVLEFLNGVFASDRKTSSIVSPGAVLDVPTSPREILERAAENAAHLQNQPLTQARVMSTLGALHHGFGLRDSAQELYETSIKVCETHLGESHPEVARSLTKLGYLLTTRDRAEEALPLLERALRIQEKKLEKDDLEKAQTLNTIGLVHHVVGRTEEALTYYERALRIREVALGPEHLDVASQLSRIGRAQAMLEHYESAERSLTRALAIKEDSLGPDHLYVANALNNLASLYRQVGDYGRSLETIGRALEIQEKALGTGHPDLLGTLFGLSLYEEESGNLASALAHLQRALSIAEERLVPGHGYARMALERLVLVSRELGDKDLEAAYQAKLFFLRIGAEVGKQLGVELGPGR